MKTCSKCKIEKESIYFSLDKSSSDGFYSRCKDCVNEAYDPTKKREYYLKNKEQISEYHQNRYSSVREQKIEYVKMYKETHKIQIAARMKAYVRERRKTDLHYKLSSYLRSRMGMALKGNFKSGSAIRDLGCSIDQLKIHLESKFYNNSRTGEVMNWNNYGFYGWHIDHIRPLIDFDLTNREEYLKAANYINLQPLWWFQNLSKGAK